MDLSIKIGTKVRHKDSKEVGIVVHLWQDEHGWIDAYVAFFGEEFPKKGKRPKEKPYVLRYMVSALGVIS